MRAFHTQACLGLYWGSNTIDFDCAAQRTTHHIMLQMMVGKNKLQST